GVFRRELADLAKKQDVKLNVQVECSSFTLAARAVRNGNVAAVLPSIAAEEFGREHVSEISLGLFKAFQRQMCLASSVRLTRIRPILAKITAALAQICRF